MHIHEKAIIYIVLRPLKIDAGLNLDNIANLITSNLFIFLFFLLFSIVLVSESQPIAWILGSVILTYGVQNNKNEDENEEKPKLYEHEMKLPQETERK